jgi:hypothetical protein
MSGFRSRHQKLGISLVSFPLTFINISYLLYLVVSALLSALIYLSKFSNLCAEVLSSSLGFVLFLSYRDLTLRVFPSRLGSSSQVPRLRGISLEGLKRNPNTEYRCGVWVSVT